MQRTFKITIEYDGTDFKGWQVQGKGERTVQGELESVLLKVFKKHVGVVGSGRTDTGVHAKGQVAHFCAETDMPVEELKRALNFNLPGDIVVVRIENVRNGFNAQFSAKKKTYSYAVFNRDCPAALHRRTSYFLPRRINVALMKREARALLGRHDFSSFANVDKTRTCDAIRTIYKLAIVKQGPWIRFTVQADGFLYKMVRNIVGTLLQVGVGYFPPGSLKKMLKRRDRRSAGFAAPAHGLCLEEVIY